jgi:hypothetical protein
MSSINKKKYGQFMTTNYEYILNRMKIPNNVDAIIEPFCGNGDLLNFLGKEKDKYTLECYDIMPKKSFIKEKDTLNNPPIYKDKYVLTNPPYLARNKCVDKTLFDKYDMNDLYKCFMKNLIDDECIGGIIIIPLNFWSSIRKADINLRKQFLWKYNIILINIFEEKVFDDTTYTICSCQFELNDISKSKKKERKLSINVFPSKQHLNIKLNQNNNYTIGGEIYDLEQTDKYKITRITEKNKNKANTNILVKCIDDNKNNMINMSIVDDDNVYVDDTPKQTARTYASLIIEPKLSMSKQKKLAKAFNLYLNEKRENYNSLFLTNYRESKDIARKRISFDLVYKITNYILNNNFDV